MYISKELIKKTGYIMRNYMFLRNDVGENDTVEFVVAMGEYMRHWSAMDYTTKQQFIEVLKEFARNNNMVFEDEDMFIREVIKNLPFKVWEKE